jgi:DNA-binding transcriptional MerR regulator
MLAIGDLAERTGVAITALRYYDELGLVRPVARVGGQRRYDDDAPKQVGVVLFLRDVGFSLEEIGRMVRGDDWRPLARRKIAELDEQAADVRAARTALVHALDCPAGEPAACPTFWSIIEDRLPGPPPVDGS